MKKNESSKQGRSFKCCGDCGKMAGSNNQIKCKACSSTNWAKRQAVKRPAKRKAVTENNKVEQKKSVKKRKTSGKNMLDEMLVLLKRNPPSKQASSSKDADAEKDGFDALDVLDFLEPSEDVIFDDLMSPMSADVDPSVVGNSYCQSPTDDAMFDNFLQEIGLSTTEQVENEISSSDDWMDNMFSDISEMGTSNISV